MIFPARPGCKFHKIRRETLLDAGFRTQGKSAFSGVDLLALAKFFAASYETGTKVTIDGKVMAVVIGSTFCCVSHSP